MNVVRRPIRQHDPARRAAARDRAKRAAIGRSPLLISSLLALLTAVGPISTDMYLPAFPAMKAALNAQPGETQMTLAAWFLGLSIGQITHGPIADHYGRRPPLLIGTALYTIGSIGCAVAGSMTVLSWWRLWAAFGGAASLVIPRAVIADVVRDGAEAARMIGRTVMVLGIVPVLAPTAGGLIAEYWDWRGIFWIAAGYGLLCTIMVAAFLPDTLPLNRHSKLRLGQLVVEYLVVWREPTFRSHALEGGFATFSLFAFLAGAPPVFLQRYGLTPAAFGAIFVLNALGYIIGTQANARLITRFGTDRVLTGGAFALAAAALAMLALAESGEDGPASMALGTMACMTALGCVLPGAALGSVLRQGHATGAGAGAASALYGTVVFFIGAISTVLVGWIGSEKPLVMTVLMLVGAAAAIGSDRQRPR